VVVVVVVAGRIGDPLDGSCGGGGEREREDGMEWEGNWSRFRLKFTILGMEMGDWELSCDEVFCWRGGEGDGRFYIIICCHHYWW